MDENVDARILERADDLTTFMYKSVSDLDELKGQIINQKETLFVQEQFRPMILDVKKAMEYVDKFQFSYTGAARMTVQEEIQLIKDEGLGKNLLSKLADKFENLNPDDIKTAKDFQKFENKMDNQVEEYKFDLKKIMNTLNQQQRLIKIDPETGNVIEPPKEPEK